MTKDTPTGRFVPQPEGYSCFFPKPLPPEPPPVLDGELSRLLSEADQALGRLDGTVAVLPNPDLFLAMYVRQEAVLSSQIEGTQASLTDVLAFEAEDASERLADVEEVVNYVAALKDGLALLEERGLSIWVLRQVHQRLMLGVRGGDKAPGTVRTSQNFIGSGRGISDATFVPPPPHAVPELLANLERYLDDPKETALVQAAIAHAQFETIHPFLDGNGRVGRLLIALVLKKRAAIEQPVLYLSLYLKGHRAEYYDRLQAVRSQGDWSGWLRFFARGVIEVAKDATRTAHAILALYKETRESVGKGKSAANLLRTVDVLFQSPIVNAKKLAATLGVSYQTANSLVGTLVKQGTLHEVTGQRRYRAFVFRRYMALFHDER